MFQLEFMRRAFLVGIMLSIVIPCIGVVMVNKRNSMIGEALSHVSLAGVTIGLIFRVNPIITAIISCAVASFSIEIMRRYFPKNSDISTAIIMSLGIGLAAVLSDFVKGAANFNSFLFGSIVSISTGEMAGVCIISVAVLVTLMLFYRELFYMGFDENAARISGVPVRQINFMFTILTALTVSVASRTVGALIVSSMLVVPIACGMQMGKSYKNTLIGAICVAVFTTIAGLVLSYYVGIKPGGTIVLLEVVIFLILVVFKTITGKGH